MARDNSKPSGKKRPPALVDLSPPKMKPKEPRSEKRNLSPLPKVGGRAANEPSRNTDGEISHAPSRQAPAHNEHLRQLPPRTIGRSRRSSEPRTTQKRNRDIGPAVLRALSLAVGAIIIGVILFVVGRNVLAGNAMTVYMGDTHMGYMRLSRESTSEIFQDEVIAHLEARAGTEVIITQAVTIEPARFVADRNIVDRSDMINRIGNTMEYQIVARAIYVDGNFEVLVRGDSCVTEIEYLIKQTWRTPYTISAEFVAEWRIEHVVVDHAYEGLRRPLQAIDILDRMVDSTHTHIIQSGENLHLIAARFGTTADRIAIANGMNSIHDTIHPGNPLQVPSRRPLLAVETVDERIEIEEIPMPTYTRPNNEMIVSTTAVAQEGMPGERHISRLITYINGVRTNEVELDAVIVRQPVTHIIYEGTRPATIERR